MCYRKLKESLKIKKGGYVGTLDPLASGFLPVAIGKATKVISFVEKENKKYLFAIHWGVKTDTADSEGKIIEKKKLFSR